MSKIEIASLLLLSALALFVNSAIVEQSLLKTFHNKEKVNILVNLLSPQNRLRRLDLQKIENSREQQLENVVISLQSHSRISQFNAIRILKQNSMVYKSFWISNQIYIRDATETLVKSLTKDPNVEKITEEVIIKLDPMEMKSSNQSVYEDPFWGISQIGAPTVWNEYNRRGEGIVVGNIDTGVRYTHFDLRNNFRSQYGWSDQIEASDFPVDDDGHGTHTMGTIVGQGGIGVAPGAEWIACRACTSDSCYGHALLGCAEFILCPSGNYINCQAPHVVSNSWGGGENRDWFNNAIEAWIAAGIVPVFAIGNDGRYGCRSAKSPADQLDNLLSVGSTTQDDTLSWFSSRGPTNGRFKPFISAPGGRILSASNSGDWEYAFSSGTSMAAPHVAGALALLLSDISLTNSSYENLLLSISKGADTESLTPPGTDCGGSDSVYPNNAFGHGRLNVTASLEHWRTLSSLQSSAHENSPPVILSVLFLNCIFCKLVYRL